MSAVSPASSLFRSMIWSTPGRAMSIFTTSTCPPFAAMCSAVSPLEIARVASALPSRSTLTTSVSPPSAA